MKTSRTKNAKRNIIWGVLEKVVQLLLPFISRTLLIRILGAKYLGLNSLFTSILSVLNITELGFGTAIVFSMYKPIAEKDNDTLCALLNTIRKIYRVVGLIILTGGLVVMPFLPKLIKGDTPADVNLYVLYGIHLFDTVISYFLFSYRVSLLRAHQRSDLVSKRALIIQIIGNVLKILALLLFRSYYAFAFVAPITTISTNLLNAYLTNKMFPQIQCRGTISPEMKSGIQKRIVGLISFKIYGVIFTSVDTIVISSFLGLVPLAIYNNYYYIQSTIVGFLTVFTSSIVAGIGNKMVTSSPDDNYQDFKKIVFANGWVVGWCSICLFCLYQPFTLLWVGEDLQFPFFTMLLMVLYFLLPRITTITATYREAAGLWWEDRFRPLIATVVNLTVNLILVRIIGMDGVLISTLVCTIFINVPFGSIVLFKHYFKRSAKEYFIQIALYLAVTAVAGSATYFVCSLVPGRGIFSLAGKAVVCVVVPNVLFWLSYRKRKEYQYASQLAYSFARPILNKIKKA